jgi:hypothetical protein
MGSGDNDDSDIAGHKGGANQFCEAIEEENVVFVELDGMGTGRWIRRRIRQRNRRIGGQAGTHTHGSNSPDPVKTENKAVDTRVNRKRREIVAGRKMPSLLERFDGSHEIIAGNGTEVDYDQHLGLRWLAKAGKLRGATCCNHPSTLPD